MKKNVFLGILLALSLIFLISLFSVSGLTFTPVINAVYISDAGTGDGSSPGSPLGNASAYYLTGTQEQRNNAYKYSALYLALDMLKNTGGKIVVCGNVTIQAGHTGNIPAESSSDFNLPELAGRLNVTITSVDPYDDTDYRVSENASLIFDRALCPVNMHVNSNTLFENINILTYIDSSSTFSSAKRGIVIGGKCFSLTMGDGLSLKVFDKGISEYISPLRENSVYFPSVAGSSRYANMTGNTDITINSGTYYRICGADFGIGVVNYGALDGNTNITINGGLFLGNVVAAGGGSQSSVTKDSFVTINGGKFLTSINGCSSFGFSPSSSLYISVKGGDFSDQPPNRLVFFATNGDTSVTPPLNAIISFNDYPKEDYNSKILNGVLQSDSTTRPVFCTRSESPSLGFSTVYAPERENVIFICDGGQGDGSSASSPLKIDNTFSSHFGSSSDGLYTPQIYMDTEFYQAFFKLKDTGGTIVVCGEINLHKDIIEGTATGSRNFSLPFNGGNKITITSVWDGVDYRSSSNARIIIETPTQISLGGETEWNNIKLVSNGSGRIISCNGYNTLFSDGIICETYNPVYASNAGYYISLVAGERYSYAETDTNITVLSGKYNYICGGSYGTNTISPMNIAYGTLTGDTHLTFGGNAVCLGGIYGSSPLAGAAGNPSSAPSVAGDVYITINGGTASYIYGSGGGRFKYPNSEVYIKITNPLTTQCTVAPTSANTANFAPERSILDLSEYPENPHNINFGSSFSDVIPPSSRITDVSIITSPSRAQYFSEDEFDFGGTRVSATYLAGITGTIPTTVYFSYHPQYTHFTVSEALNPSITSVNILYGGRVAGTHSVQVASRPELEILGAQIKTADMMSQGLRFVASVQKGLSLTPTAYGFLVLPSDVLKYDGELRIDRISGAYNIDATGTYLRSELGDDYYDSIYNGSDFMIFSGVFENISVENYSTEYTAVSYIKYSHNGTEYVSYSKPIRRSVYSVALAVANSEQESVSSKEWMRINIIDRVESNAKNPISERRSLELRQGAVEYMRQMGYVQWSTPVTIDYGGQLTYGTPTYQANTIYHGLPYNGANGNYEAFSALLVNDVLTTDNTGWRFLPGNSCSTSIAIAYNNVINSISRDVGAAKMIPIFNYGYEMVGSYAQPSLVTTTKYIFEQGGEDENARRQVMYQAYSSLLPGDIVISRWNREQNEMLAHSRMVVGYPNIVLNQDGTINGAASTIRIIEQTSALKESTGRNTTWLDIDYTFDSLASGTVYIPVGSPQLRSGFAEIPYCTVRKFNSPADITSGIKGILKSNYNIYQIDYKIIDLSGGIVKSGSIYPNFTNTYTLNENAEINSAISSLQSGGYSFKLSAKYNGGIYELLDISFSK